MKQLLAQTLADVVGELGVPIDSSHTDRNGLADRSIELPDGRLYPFQAGASEDDVRRML